MEIGQKMLNPSSIIHHPSSRTGQAPLDRKAYLTGQAVVEYLLVFAALAVITVLSLSAFYPKVKEIAQGSEDKPGLFQEAMERIAQ